MRWLRRAVVERLNRGMGVDDVAAAARADAITDKQAVLDHATRLRDGGRLQEALHVIDLLALAPGDDPHVVLARKLKAPVCTAQEGRPQLCLPQLLRDIAMKAGVQGGVQSSSRTVALAMPPPSHMDCRP
ncbi:hypothetical protein [Streptomyces purpurogeneiscleroticus]|uniref:hypothetical protein n=1 Tax=Streptomyces purpurogeneiscleroticus TaxID=68259 RepID=UPI001CBFC080|nr:hypothetical protein [Streptomyces purpurogeneiscleroticus]